MNKYVYKCEHFMCALSMPGTINKKLQRLIDKYSSEGWILHSYKFVDLNTFCIVVFYKEEKNV